MRNFTLTVHGSPVTCLLLEAGDDPMPGERQLCVARDDSAITHALRARLQNEEWLLDPKFRKLKLVERFSIKLTESHQVDVFNFWEKLERVQINRIGAALALLRSHLINPHLWQLQSIQILGDAVTNEKSGGFMYGAERPDQRRFELYPDAFDAGRYLRTLACTTVEGTVIHETTHVCLEPTLARYWGQARAQTGWELLPQGQLNQLPGGFVSSHRIRNPKDCPTFYAALQPNDDRAESVIAYLTHSRLNLIRTKLVGLVLRRPLKSIRSAPAKVETVEAVMPEIPQPIFRLDYANPPVFQDASD